MSLVDTSDVNRMIAQFCASGYKTYTFNGVREVIAGCPESFAALESLYAALMRVTITPQEICEGGGRQTVIANNIKNALEAEGFRSEVRFATQTCVYESPEFNHTFTRRLCHILDAAKGPCILEIQWNSKDAVFNRDTASFDSVFKAGLCKFAVLITRDSDLQSLFHELGVGKKYGASTTHINKFLEITQASSNIAGSCPLIVCAITKDRIV